MKKVFNLSFFFSLLYNFSEVEIMEEKMIIPNHIGIIMDGNGRWAQERGQIRTFGHKKAVENLKELCIHMADVGVKYASLYAFSTENFKRERSEVDFLKHLIKNLIF